MSKKQGYERVKERYLAPTNIKTFFCNYLKMRLDSSTFEISPSRFLSFFWQSSLISANCSKNALVNAEHENSYTSIRRFQRSRMMYKEFVETFQAPKQQKEVVLSSQQRQTMHFATDTWSSKL